MSVISSLLKSSDKLSEIKTLIEKPNRELIPVLLFILMSEDFEKDEDLLSAAGLALTALLTTSTFDTSVVIMDASITNDSENGKSLRRELIKPQKGKKVTMRTLTLAFHIFTICSWEYDPQILSDALDVILQFIDFQKFKMSTRMLLDAVDFSIGFFTSDDSSIKEKGLDLFRKIHKIAVSNNNVELLVVTNSVRELFEIV